MTEALPRELYPADPLMIGAWASALIVSIKREDLFKRYEEETGDNYKPSQTPMNRLIADSTGQDRKFLIRYIKWFNANVWGPLDTVAGG